MSVQSCLRDRSRHSERASRLPLASAILVTILVIATSCADATFIDRITVANETDYPAQVTVTSKGERAWLALTTIRAHSERVVEQVIDQGDRWVFRFSYIEKHEEDVEFSRDELESSGWNIEVPQSFSETLVEMGIEPPVQ